MIELKRNDEVQLEITGAAFEGKAIARLDGIVVFVENAIPGDVITAKILKIKRNHAEAIILRIEKPSTLRVTPRCQYFGACGGCKWQNVDYQAQLRFKHQHVIDSFERIGGFSNLNINPIIGSDDIFFYRSKMEFSFSSMQWLTEKPAKILDVGSGIVENYSSNLESTIADKQFPVYLGLHVPQRYDKVLDIKECHLQSHISNHILNFTREFARTNNLNVYDSHTDSGYLRFLVIRESSDLRNPVQRDKKIKEVMVNLVTRTDESNIMQKYSGELVKICPEITTVINTVNLKKSQIAFGEIEKVYYGSGTITERIGRNRFKISTSSFFQTNVAQAEKLYQAAKELGEFKPTDIVYDLYSGTGSIALFIADAVQQVIGIESVESAVRDAENNAKHNGVINCTFHLGDLKDRLTKDLDWMSSYPKPNVLIIDPPRSGMHPKVVEEINKLEVERIVYVSCNPATQARDVKTLCEEKYRLVKLQPVDMFPHTYHIENIALLVRK